MDEQISNSARNNIKQLAIFWILALYPDKIAFDWTNCLNSYNSTKNKNSNLTARIIISQEQSWPSGLLVYLISHKWVQCWFSGQNSQHVSAGRLKKTISSTRKVWMGV